MSSLSNSADPVLTSATYALLTDAVRMLDEPGSFTDADIDELRAHGWNDRILADVVGLVALNQLTDSFNLVAGLPALSAIESESS